MQAVGALWQEAVFDPTDITAIEIETFHESLRLAGPHPASCDEAQYSLCWPVAAMVMALAEGRDFTAFDVSEDALTRDDIHQLAARIKLVENDDFNKVFPQLRQSRVHIDFVNGSRRTAFSAHTIGDPETPLSYAEMLAKFDNLILSTPFASRAALLKHACLTSGAKHLESNWQELLFALQ